MDQVEFLKSTELLSGVPEGLLKEIVAGMTELHAHAGDTIFREGESGEVVYLIREGRVKLERDGVELLCLSEGSCLGEFALLDEAPRSASAVADTETHLLSWNREGFHKVLRENPELVRGILKILIGKLRQDVAVQVEATREHERWRQDLKRAHEIQMAMLPAGEFSSDRIEIAGYSCPAEEVGGDYYDYATLPGDRLGLMIADVMGHGFYAGLLVAMTKSCLRGQIGIDPTPEIVMESVNRTVFNSVQVGMLMTCCYILFDWESGKLRYTNAGHLYPYWYSAAEDSLDRLVSTDLLLGVPGSDNYKYSSQLRPFGPGDLLVLFTDGIDEAEDPKGEQFGQDRLGDIILANRGESAGGLRDRVLKEISSHTGGAPQADDITLVVAKAR